MEIKKYLVIGNPISHSLSPQLQNYWIKTNNIKAIYDKIKVEDHELNTFIQNIREQKIAGCNVTVPFKNAVIPYLDILSPEAKKTQSVNTIVFDGTKLVGHNTDIVGFSKAIENIKYSLKDKKVFILGAGGVVPSIIFALNKMKASEIIISNRTRQKAENIKAEFKDIKVLDWGEIPGFDIIINATSLGLNNEEINLDFNNIGRNKLFYDVIYNPTKTNFLKEGKRLGNQTENGRLMFAYQAQQAFKLWHGIEPKIDRETIEVLNND